MPENGRLVWKSIESIGRLRSVLHALPAVRAIHLLRHPCGYVASVMRGETHGRFQDNRGASEDYGILKILLDSTLARQRGLTIEYFQTLTPVERLAWRWALFNDEAVHASEDSERCRSVRYEDVCADPVAVIKDIYKFVALDWSMQTEEFVLKSTTQNVSDYYSVFKDPLTAAYKWRNELDAASINRILSITRDTVPGRLFVEDL